MIKKKEERKGAAFTIFMPLAYCFRGSLDYTFGQELIPPSKMKKKPNLKNISESILKHFTVLHSEFLDHDLPHRHTHLPCVTRN